MGLNRRAFLHQAGLTLSALGVSQIGLSALASRYQKALAEPSRRKLALLVGINQYPEAAYKSASGLGSPLTGCVTDVELQRELLIHRFGFVPSDIVTLTNEQATRQAIQTAFLEHLSAQGRPGDIVVFHFSGYGSQVKLSDASGQMQNSLVAVDSLLPTEAQPTVNDFLEDTLWLLVRSLKTQKITTILDLSYANAIELLQGSLRVRTRPMVPEGQISPAELALQERLLSEVKISRAQIQAQHRAGQTPGVVLAAAAHAGIAAESRWSGFSAGLFTYALTQQLWWSTPATTLRISLSRAAGNVEQRIGRKQQPQMIGQKSRDPSLSAYYTELAQSTNAEGVITAVKDNGRSLDLWLGGLPAVVLEQYQAGSLVAVPNTAEAKPESSSIESSSTNANPALPLLQLHNRTGLTAEARLYGTMREPEVLRAGQLLWEQVRLLPKSVGLTVFLDSTLERIERVDATSAFSSIPVVASVVTGEQPADCIFGKAQGIAQATLASTQQNSPPETSLETEPEPAGEPVPKSGYGLFWLGRAAIPNTLADSEEAVKTAISRLTPELRTLLAIKLLRSTVNEGSSQLGIRATLEMAAPQERLIMQQQTSRAVDSPPDSQVIPLLNGSGDIPALPIDSRIQYRLYNYSDRPLYFILLGLDTSGSAIALYPTPAIAADEANPRPTPEDSIIQPGQTLVVPQPLVSSEWTIHGPRGFAENYLIFSPAPLNRTFDALAGAMRSVGSARRVSLLSHPLEVARAVLADLHEASQPFVKAYNLEVPTDAHAFHVNAWATLSFMYQVG